MEYVRQTIILVGTRADMWKRVGNTGKDVKSCVERSNMLPNGPACRPGGGPATAGAATSGVARLSVMVGIRLVGLYLSIYLSIYLLNCNPSKLTYMNVGMDVQYM